MIISQKLVNSVFSFFLFSWFAIFILYFFLSFICLIDWQINKCLLLQEFQKSSNSISLIVVKVIAWHQQRNCSLDQMMNLRQCPWKHLVKEPFFGCLPFWTTSSWRHTSKEHSFHFFIWFSNQYKKSFHCSFLSGKVAIDVPFEILVFFGNKIPMQARIRRQNGQSNSQSTATECYCIQNSFTMFPFPSGLEMEAVMIAFNWNVDWCFGEGLVGCMLESQREPIQLRIKKVGEILHNKKSNNQLFSLTLLTVRIMSAPASNISPKRRIFSQ